MAFLRRRHGLEAVKVPHPLLGPVLRDGHGLLLYEDDVLSATEAPTSARAGRVQGASQPASAPLRPGRRVFAFVRLAPGGRSVMLCGASLVAFTHSRNSLLKLAISAAYRCGARGYNLPLSLLKKSW